MAWNLAQGVEAQVRRGEKGARVQYWTRPPGLVKDERGKPVGDGEGNKVYRAVQREKTSYCAPPPLSRPKSRSSTGPSIVGSTDFSPPAPPCVCANALAITP